MKVALVLASILVLPNPAISQEPTEQVLRAYCETPPYNPGGGGKNCWSEWQEIKAPEGYVFAKDSATGGLLSTQGGEHGECIVEWSEPREIIPNVTQPSKVRMRAYGEMNHGIGEGGHSRCEYKIKLVKIP